jgi:acetamidase/formamidase
MTADVALDKDTVHWGYFSKDLAPVKTIASGDEVTVEMATHHACDDWDKMVKGDAGMESIFTWDADGKNEPDRGATGGGDGVHVLTGPIFVTEAEPGDILKVEILELAPRANPQGKTFGSNAAAWWGFQARVDEADGTKFDAGDFTETPNSNDEYVTIYEVVSDEGGQDFAVPSYQMEWPKLTDPGGTERNYIQYPGTCVPHDVHGDTTPSTDVADMGWTKAAPIVYPTPSAAFSTAKIPINYHVGCMGLPPASHAKVDSIPPMPTGGNLDNKRIGVGTTMYYPVEVAGGLLSMGDAHAAQGDSELDGTGIETSLTGKFKVTVIKAAAFNNWQTALDFPLGETATEWIVHGFTETDYLETFSANPGDIYGASSIDKAMKNAFTQTRKFLMNLHGLTDEEATTLITQGVDFGMTQLVDGNWGVHGIIPKVIFSGPPAKSPETPPKKTTSGTQGTFVPHAFLATLVAAAIAACV